MGDGEFDVIIGDIVPEAVIKQVELTDATVMKKK